MPKKSFTIEVDSPPERAYLPGATVTGKVHLTVHESKVYKSVQVTLRGFAEVEWHDGDRKSGRRYYAREDFVTLNDIVWERSAVEGNKLPAGAHHWPFSILLTGDNLLPSFTGDLGKIQYSLEAKIVQDTLFKKDSKVETVFEVGAERVPIDKPEMLRPLAQESQTKVGGGLCCSAGSVNITASIPRTGYCILEDSIPLEVQTENGSSHQIRYLQVCLKQKIRYKGHYQSGLIRLDTKFRVENNVITSVRSDAIPARSTECWNLTPISVPFAYVSVTNCSLISITYLLELTAIGTGARIELPIVLGNVALPRQQTAARLSQVPLSPTADPMMYPPSTADMHGRLQRGSYAELPPPAMNWLDASQQYPPASGHYLPGHAPQPGMGVADPAALGQFLPPAGAIPYVPE